MWVRRLLIGGSPDQGRYTASAVNDGACPEKNNPPQYGSKFNCTAATGLESCLLPNYYYGQLQTVRELKDVVG